MIALVAALSLFGGAFLIFNTLAMTVAERARDVGLLRAAGMTRRQVTLLVLIFAGHLGVAGVGMRLGDRGGARSCGDGVRVGPGRGGRPGAPGELVIPPGRVAPRRALLGFGVTIAAALEPALRARPGSRRSRHSTARLEQTAILRARLRWLTLHLRGGRGGRGSRSGPARRTGSAGLLRPLAVYGLLLGVALVSPFLVWSAGPAGRGDRAGPFLPAEERLTRSSSSATQVAPR